MIILGITKEDSKGVDDIYVSSFNDLGLYTLCNAPF
jgi:hypothetical protein